MKLTGSRAERALSGSRPVLASARRRIGAWVRLLISAALLAMLLTHLDVGRASQILLGARVELVVLTFALLLVDCFMAAYKWHVLLWGLHRGITYRSVVRLYFVSRFVGSFMPGGVDLVRLYGLTRATSDLALVFSSLLTERVLALVSLIGLLVAGLLVAPPGLPPDLARWAWVGLAALVCGCVALMHPRARLVTVRLLPGGWLAPLRDQLAKVYACLDAYRARPVLMAWSLAVAFAYQAFRIVTVVVAAWALQLAIPTVYLVVIMPVVIFVTLLPISVAGGLGVRETGFVYLLALVSVSPAAAFALSLLISLLVILTALPGAWFYMRAGVVGGPPAGAGVGKGLPAAATVGSDPRQPREEV